MAVLFTVDHIVVVFFLSLLAWAGVSDALSFRIPNATTLGIALLYPIYILASPVSVDWLGGLATAAILFAIGFVTFAKGAAGGGDVKLLAASALWVGPRFVLPFLMIMGLTGGLLAVIVWIRQYARRFKTAGIAGLMLPDMPGAPTPSGQVPYGVAIAFGAACSGIQLLTS